MILSFYDKPTQKVFNGEKLTRKEEKAYGDLNIDKAKTRLIQLDNAEFSDIGAGGPPLFFHAHSGSNECTIDAEKRNSKWRIGFKWDKNKENVEDVRIFDPH